jgi:hypothetical protein
VEIADEAERALRELLMPVGTKLAALAMNAQINR